MQPDGVESIAFHIQYKKRVVIYVLSCPVVVLSCQFKRVFDSQCRFVCTSARHSLRVCSTLGLEATDMVSQTTLAVS